MNAQGLVSESRGTSIDSRYGPPSASAFSSAARKPSGEVTRAALEKALADGGPYVISVEVPTDSEISPWTFIHPAKP